MSESSEDRIRLLIVDDVPETRENIRKLLQFEPDIVVVGIARTGVEAVQVAEETQPDVVLMDINMPDMDGIRATEALLEKVPFAQIVILSVQSEADYMRRAMLAGARDFLAKPPSGDELVSTIRLVSKRAKEQRKKLAKPAVEAAPPGDGRGPGGTRPLGKLVTVYSPKGGVGCSMLATNLAVGLNSDETPTVLVDTNFQFGDVAVFLNLQVKNSFIDLAARSEELEIDFVNEVLIPHDSGLKVLAAPPRPEMADEINAEQVRRVLAFLKAHYAYVLVDTSSTMDDIALAALDLSDLLVAVATTEIPSIKDVRLLFDLLAVLEFHKQAIFFVINKFDRRTGITAEAVAENLKQPVEATIPFDERSVLESINRGVPLLLGDKSRPIAKNLLDLLATVRQRLMVAEAEEQAQQEPERSRLFRR
jgi:pilus assembly protein CpaE